MRPVLYVRQLSQSLCAGAASVLGCVEAVVQLAGFSVSISSDVGKLLRKVIDVSSGSVALIAWQSSCIGETACRHSLLCSATALGR